MSCPSAFSAQRPARYLLALLGRVRAGGLVWLSPPCGSWGWLARSTFQRCPDNIAGPPGNCMAQMNNRIARVTALAALAAHRRDVRVVIEQPLNSLLYEFQFMKDMLRLLGTERVTFSAGSYGAPSRKCLEIRTTAPWGPFLAFRARVLQAAQVPRTCQVLAVKRGNAVTGKRAALAASAEYPRDLCRYVAILQQRCYSRSAALCWRVGMVMQTCLAREHGFQLAVAEAVLTYLGTWTRSPAPPNEQF